MPEKSSNIDQLSWCIGKCKLFVKITSVQDKLDYFFCYLRTGGLFCLWHKRAKEVQIKLDIDR